MITKPTNQDKQLVENVLLQEIIAFINHSPMADDPVDYIKTNKRLSSLTISDDDMKTIFCSYMTRMSLHIQKL